jgi:hypothetical protein
MAAPGDGHRDRVAAAVERPGLAGLKEFGMKRSAKQLEDQFAGLGSQ